MTLIKARRWPMQIGQRSFLQIAAVSGGLLLAACGGPRQATAPAAEPATPVIAAPPPVTLTMPADVPGEPPRRPESRDTLGKTAAEMRVLFGAPGLLRREPPSEIWQYTAPAFGQGDKRASGCVLIFVLYPENEAANTDSQAVLRVQHAQSLPRRRGDPVGDADCVEALLKVPPTRVAPGS